MLELFPLERLPPRPAEDDDLAERISRLKVTQNNLIVQKAKGDSRNNVNRPGELYKRYRTVEELPATAKAFYELAGRVIPLQNNTFNVPALAGLPGRNIALPGISLIEMPTSVKGNIIGQAGTLKYIF